MATAVELTEEQSAAVESIMTWVSEGNRPDFRMGGLAGTGKTVTTSYVINALRHKRMRVGVGAFTGKAASVLRKKGVISAQTLHSMIYTPERDVRGKIVFVKRPSLPFDIVVVDESSMVSYDIHADLMSFKIPVLFVGDMGQLEPVGNDPKLMEESRLNAKLTQIHRQAAGSPIIRFAHELRKGLMMSKEKPCEALQFGGWDRFIGALDENVDQMICGYNQTRMNINNAYRTAMGYHDVLHVGEKVICLKNNMELGIFNGMIGIVKEISDIRTRFIEASVEDDSGRTMHYVMDRKQFGLPNTLDYREQNPEWTYWTYAYCLSAHKSQGSEFDKVAVWEEVVGSGADAFRRWSYTAATRASKQLIYCRR